jgi:uncharacterized protein
MGRVDSYPDGTFCWVDLGTRDRTGAKAFYGELFGWGIEDLDGYSMCRLDGADVAGVHHHGEDEATEWSSFIAVDDADAAAARARGLGATILTEPFDMEGVARMAPIRDPAGALVTLWQPKGFAGAGLVNEVGTWNWNELVAPDLDAAAAFYGGLFGWQANLIPGPLPRTSFSLGNLLVGGGHAPTEQEGQGSRWTVSFRVADADQSVATVQRLGGTVLLPPRDVPVGRFAIVADPAGAAFIVTASPGGAFRGVDGS